MEKITRILEEHEKRIFQLEQILIGKKEQENFNHPELSNIQDEIIAFSDNLGIKEEKIMELIDFQEKLPRLMNVPKEKTRAKLQAKSLMLLSILSVRVYKLSLNTKIIKDLFTLSRVPMERMDKLYSSTIFKRYFSKSGENIKFSWAGEKEAEKMILEIVKE